MKKVVFELAGYIFNLKRENNAEKAFNNLKKIVRNGVYSTIMTLPSSYWQTHHEGTFGDYMTMKEGDNVYFFSNRKIYGIGVLKSINVDCKLLNFPDSDLPIDIDFSNSSEKMILNDSIDNKQNRMLCTFIGSPHFFEHGVDMDDVLASSPQSFKMLRAFWKLSFIKIDDEENEALKNVILKSNEENLYSKKNIFSLSSTIHNRIRQIANEDYRVTSDNILSSCGKDDGRIGHEMALEVGVLDYITRSKTQVFGSWDYLTHQVIASPFKPIDYMDKMDVFGYRYIPNFNAISKYLVIEIKKDVANEEVIGQVMKYVDWVNQEYSYGDYNMIEAYVVAHEFPESVIKMKKESAVRHYVKGGRNVVSLKWDNLKLIKYDFDSDTKKLSFTEV